MHKADGSALLAGAMSRFKAGDAVAGRQMLQEATAAGYLPAAVQLAVWELIGLGGPLDVGAAAGRLRDAADRGDGPASVLFAQLLAAGAGGLQRDFQAAVSRLLRAAEAGEPRAAVQLAILTPADSENSSDRNALLRLAAAAGEPIARIFLDLWRATPAGPEVDWLRVRERLALPHERRLPAPELHSEQPRIVAVRGLFTRDECMYVVLKGVPMLRPSRVFGRDGRPVPDPMRTNDSAKFGLLEADAVMQSLDLRAAAALGHPAENGEGFALLRYERGQQYLPHCDWIDPRPPAARAEIDRWGQRVATCVVYLNDGFEGGATEFPRLRLSFLGGIGDALTWDNVLPGGEPDPMSLHAGRPPTQGTKLLLSKWMRDKSQMDRDR